MALLHRPSLARYAGWFLFLAGCGGAQPKPAADCRTAGNAVILGCKQKIDRGPPPPSLRVNQLGYVPAFAKWAVFVTSETAPLDWQLVDASGKALAAGKTKSFGEDADSGDKVQQIDLSDARAVGRGLRVRVGKDESPAFDLRPDLYRSLTYDALAYFYHARSGIELKLPYVGDAKWARPAGHQSDQSVPCAPEAKCSYTLDVSGGWYDAGDQGKYVVNAGISVWTLLNLWERTKQFAPARLAAFGDGKLRIPENANQLPDLLDEVRWELEFMLKMQVPADKDPARAGLVHHKIHDEQWTSLGGAPPTDVAKIKIRRLLRPVSTAATLNLAATAAQCARVYREFDPAFADRCLAAAERAWQAAQKFPKLFASPDDKTGGGPYDDDWLADEFYWAACELFITTNKPEYHQYAAHSPFHLRIPKGGDKSAVSGPPTVMTWQQTAGLGTISLAVVPNDFGKVALGVARGRIRERADDFLAIVAKQGYRVPFRADQGKYPWGSNSFVVNNALVLGLAHDLTGERKYLDGMVDAMNYLLGVNAMGQSYVTGYGSRPLQNPHHRFWAHELNPALPGPPPGCLSGGPNSDLQDPKVQEAGLAGCKPQKCFFDDIDSWSTNEITINWNAPLAWVAAYLDEQAPAGK
jgi:endoglucanase